MKKIVGYLRDYWRAEFHGGVYSVFGIGMAAIIWFNYSYGLFAREVSPYFGQWKQWGIYFVIFGLPYAGVILLENGWKGDWRRLRQPGLWATVAFAMALLSFSMFFHWYRDWAADLFPPALRSYGTTLFWNLKRVLSLLLPLLIYRWWRDRKAHGFYGWRIGGADLRPYFLMLAIVLPGVIWASFQPDFLQAYPSWVPGSLERKSGVSIPGLVAIYELIYGLDYALIELFFRGFLVIGMVKWLGKRAILPMVAVYCILHFGKPAGEAISSIFGGYILGVIALYTRSIWGGIVVHMGLAWMMDLAAGMQLWWR
ncbi:MAG: CPBP family intramembrane glutamic endopeptidase [Bacteroidota bacterium]